MQVTYYMITYDKPGPQLMEIGAAPLLSCDNNMH